MKRYGRRNRMPTVRRRRSMVRRRRAVVRRRRTYRKSKLPRWQVTKVAPQNQSFWYLPPLKGSSKYAKMFAQNAMRKIQTQVAGYVTCTEGSQGIYTWSWFGYAGLQNVASAFSQPSTTTNVPNNTAKFYVHSQETQMYFTNSSNAPLMVDLYLWRAKKDTNTNVTDHWTKLLKVEGSTATDYTTSWNCKPDVSCPDLHNFWKLCKKRSVTMVPGGNFVQRINFLRRRTFDNSMISAQIDVDSYFRGWTYQMQIIVRGFPATDVTTASTIETTIGKVDMIENTMINCKAVAQNSNTWSGSFVTPALTTGSTIYNMATGTTSTVANI